MPAFTGTLIKYPARATLLWYLGLVTLGTGLLQLPVCRAEGKAPIGPAEALFTATSAACVTGLSVRSTEHDFSPLGQGVILLLVQLGGLGIMTVTTLISIQIGGAVRLRERAVLTETLGAGRGVEPAALLRRVLKFTLAIEGVGFVVLTARNLFLLPPLEAAWHGLFHSVSAFCNAGFALHDDSLSGFVGDPIVNLTIGALVIIGGLGFPVLLDLTALRREGWRPFWKKAQLHSKIVLVSTPVLIVAGAAALLVFEWNGAFAEQPWGTRLQAALFQSVTCRTAGFNTVPLGSLTNASLFCMMLLMVVGGGACSTAGGVKVSTAFLLLLRAVNSMRGRPHVQIFRRTVPDAVVNRAAATVFVFGVLGIVALTLLLAMEQSHIPHGEAQGLFMEAGFEIISALGTVGLSLGITSNLTFGGQLLVAFLMLAGRIGPISIFAAISRVPRRAAIDYPHESLLVG